MLGFIHERKSGLCIQDIWSGDPRRAAPIVRDRCLTQPRLEWTKASLPGAEQKRSSSDQPD
jgi:hypothetical protein